MIYKWFLTNRGKLTINYQKPRYWGTWKGQIIYAIVCDGADKLNDLREKTDLSDESLNKTLSELFDLGLMERRYGNYRVSFELWKEYKNSSFVKKHKESIFSKEKKRALIDWIEKWKNIKNLEFPIEAKHLFFRWQTLG